MLRPVKERVVSPIAGVLARRVHPNTITIAAFALGVVAFICLLQHEMLLCATFWLLGRLLDGLDGAVARRSGAQSDLGGYLDMLLDVIAYALIPLGMALAFPSPAVFIAVAVLLAVFYVNIASWLYLSALMEKRKKGAEYAATTSLFMPSGLIEGTETIVFYTLFIAFPGMFVVLAYTMAAMTTITVAQRLVWALRTLPVQAVPPGTRAE
jgi:phosphatidylglycerophosphate synthase